MTDEQTKQEVPRSVLVVVAHPDDVDFGCAGTIAAWTARGCQATYCIVTDGAAGAADTRADPSALAAIRQAEQREAARQVGVDDVVFLGFPDGALRPSMEVRREITRVIRRVRPQRVIGMSPERDYTLLRVSHPDHLAAGEATLCAVYPDSRNPYAHPELLEEGLAPFEVPELWLTGAPDADYAIDITSTFEAKAAALAAHRSQITDPEGLAKMLREGMAATGRRFGLGDGRLAEVFRVVGI